MVILCGLTTLNITYKPSTLKCTSVAYIYVLYFRIIYSTFKIHTTTLILNSIYLKTTNIKLDSWYYLLEVCSFHILFSFISSHPLLSSCLISENKCICLHPKIYPKSTIPHLVYNLTLFVSQVSANPLTSLLDSSTASQESVSNTAIRKIFENIGGPPSS